MIRLFFFILAVAGLAAAVAWFADRPGELVLVWQGYRVETSVMVAALGLLVLTFAALAAWTGLRLVIGLPAAFSGFLRTRRTAKGYAALSRGMIAVGAGDAAQASRAADQARRILGREPLTLLLEAQTAQLKGDRKGARRSFQDMLASPDTEILGLRGLFVEAQRVGDRAAMRGYAERALRLNAATGWAATALFDMQCADRDWAGALATLDANQAHKLVDKARARRQRAVLLTAQALELGAGERERAQALALEALKLAGDLVPAAALAGRLIADSGNVRRATRVLEKAWKLSPHPEIAEAYINVRAGDSTRDRLRRMRTLASRLPGEKEGALAVAGAAIDARDWAAARAALAPHVSAGPTQRVCSLMAEIEEGEHGDSAGVHAWLGRAVRAPRDAAWTADGVVSESWAPLSPVTGRLDAFEWKVPLAQSEGPRIGAASGRPVAGLAAPQAGAPAGPGEGAAMTAQAGAAPVIEASAEPGHRSEAAGAAAAGKTAAAKDAMASPHGGGETAAAAPATRADKAGPAPSDGGGADAKPRTGGAAMPDRAAIIEPLRAPDDPGPGGDAIGEDVVLPRRPR